MSGPAFISRRSGPPAQPGITTAVELLARVLAHMAAGQGVSVVPAHAELTAQQAAEMLNVSRPFLIGLLDLAGAGQVD